MPSRAPERLLHARDILVRFKKVYDLRRDADAAEFLGVTPSTVSTWKRRNSIDVTLLVEKCLSIPTKGLRVVNLHWLITGKGEPTFETARSMMMEAIVETSETSATVEEVERRVRAKLHQQGSIVSTKKATRKHVGSDRKDEVSGTTKKPRGQ